MWLDRLSLSLGLGGSGFVDGALSGEMRVKEEVNGEFDFTNAGAAASSSSSSSSLNATPTPAPTTTTKVQPTLSLSSASRLLPAYSIYIPPPSIGVPGSSVDSGFAFPFDPSSSSSSTSHASSSTLQLGTASASTTPQITPALLALLPSAEKCDRFLKEAGEVVGVRGLGTFFESPREKDSKEKDKEIHGWRRFRKRALKFLLAASPSASASRPIHRSSSRRSNASSTPSSSSSSSSCSASEDESEQDGQTASTSRPVEETEKQRLVRERQELARKIYFGGGGGTGTGSVDARIVRERVGGEPVRRRKVPKDADGKSKREGTQGTRMSLTFFAVLCAGLAVGAQRCHKTTTDPSFLYVLSQQALGVWETCSGGSADEKERVEYMQACLLGLQVLIGGEDEDGEDSQRTERRGIVKGLACSLFTVSLFKI